MDMKESKRYLAIIAAALVLLVTLIYAVAYDEFRYQTMESDTLSASALVGEIVDGMIIEQTMLMPADTITALSVMAGTYGRENEGALQLTLSDRSGEILSRAEMNVHTIEDGVYTSVTLDKPIEGRQGETLLLSVQSQGCLPGSAAAIYAGSSVSTGRFDLAKAIATEDLYTINGQQGVGRLCVKAVGVNELIFYKIYWPMMLLAAAVCAVLGWYWWKGAKAGKNNPLIAVCTLMTRYRFLIKQLVIRDFKTKYKRSALGMVWSFLNPLMTMTVQYVIFSTIFRSDTPNYPVYLLTGIVFFGFFNQTVTAGLISITVNAPLIKKVYMPKYIYPLSKVLSSLVNFAIGLVPLLLVMLITGTAFTPALLLLIFDILCLTVFIIGMVLFMCTANTFFQDTEFLWGVVGMMWTYATPIFYPESIIPAAILPIYRLNPMYQYITFARTCIIDGVSPAPSAYLGCMVTAVAVFALGAWFFKKNQDKFVLHV